MRSTRMWYIRTDGELAAFDFLAATAGGQMARANMGEKPLFEEHGWAHFFPEIRQDLYLCLDDGWDVPPDATNANGVHPSVPWS